MEPSDQRASDGRVYPMFAGLVPDSDNAAQKRRRSSAVRSKARSQATTLFAAWGQETPSPSTPPPRAESIQRTVRGTCTGDEVHPFFAKREGRSALSRTRPEHARPMPTVCAPWPQRDMVHVVPSGKVQRRSLAWPRITKKARECAAAPRDLSWLSCAHAEQGPRRGAGVVCEAALVLPADANMQPAPRPSLAYIAADLASQLSPDTPLPPVVSHLYEQIAKAPCHTLSAAPRPSAHASLWMDHWRPQCAAHVLGNEASAAILRDWLHDLRVSYSGTQQRHIQTRVAPRKRGRPRVDDDDEFDPDEAAWFDQFRSTGDEEATLTNCMVLVGPTGVGKSAAVYACAAEVGFEVFELYPGMGRRSGKDMASAVGHVMRNHMVSSDKRAHDEDMPHQSLILLDEVDVLFDDDAGFWPAVIDMVGDSRRPVVLTCTDVRAIPLGDLPVQRVLEWVPPPPHAVAAYLQLVALAEGYIVSNAAMRALYMSTRPEAETLTPRSGGVMPSSHMYPSTYVTPTGPSYDLRAALAQLPWICLQTRAKEVLKSIERPSHDAKQETQPRQHTLRSLAHDLDRLSFADAVCTERAYTDEYAPLPHGRANVSPVPSVPSTRAHDGPGAQALTATIRATLTPALPDTLALASRMDHDRLEFCQRMDTVMRLLHVPVHEHLPRQSIPLEYAPYVRIMHQCDVARQHAWAALLYNAASAMPGRATRNSARLALDMPGMRGWHAYLPFGPAELDAIRTTAFREHS